MTFINLSEHEPGVKGCGVLHAYNGREYVAAAVVSDVTAEEFERYCEIAQADPERPEECRLQGSFYTGGFAEERCVEESEMLHKLSEFTELMRGLLVLLGMREEEIDAQVSARVAEMRAAAKPLH